MVKKVEQYYVYIYITYIFILYTFLPLVFYLRIPLFFLKFNL